MGCPVVNAFEAHGAFADMGKPDMAHRRQIRTIYWPRNDVAGSLNDFRRSAKADIRAAIPAFTAMKSASPSTSEIIL